jgi:sulfotransferase family protein
MADDAVARPGPPFFIVGSARSGTTLLRLMLNAHRDVAVPPESRFVTELWNGAPEVDVRAFLDALAAHKRFTAWELPIEEVRRAIGTATTIPYAEAIDATYRAYARAKGKKRWGDKTPRYVEHIPFLAGLFPDARFIHLVRDGRNVALSYADVPFGPKTVARAAELWARRVSEGVDAGRSLEPGRYLEMRYEDLVEDIEGRSKELTEFLDLAFDPGMLDYTEGSRSDVLPRAAKYNPKVSQPPIGNARSWETEMADRHVAVFEAVAGRTLAELGYPRRHPAPGPLVRLEATLGRLGLPVGRLERTTST